MEIITTCTSLVVTLILSQPVGLLIPYVFLMLNGMKGPGINDDGSGILALLEIATQLTKFSVNNAVRFSFWAAEEIGLLGSNYYVSQLSAEEIAKIRIYLNFDMIASPNYIYAVYDGDGSAFNVSGPSGSAQGENLLVTYLNSVGLKTVPTKFDGRSDYQAFINAGMPSSGLFTGAEGIKTVEEQALFAGQAGVAYDVNYHGAGDTVQNLNMDAWIQNSKVGDVCARKLLNTAKVPDRLSPTRWPHTESASIPYRPGLYSRADL